MGAFEFGCNNNVAGENLDPNRLREECIIAFKVYDSCRQQDCLERDALGPARAYEKSYIEGVCFNEGEVINPPDNAASVSIDNLKVKKVIIDDKQENAFKDGYWNITLKYIFVYTLTFRDSMGNVIGAVKAASTFTKKITLFGSIGTDITISTDLFSDCKNSNTLQADPFVLVEAKAVPLSAELVLCGGCCCCDGESTTTQPIEVNVTIGLFTIIKLFRIVNLTVESRGFCVPEECEEVSALNPCEFFNSLDFPLDIFAPPQRPEFVAGITNNIPNNKDDNDSNCNCNTNNCGCNTNNCDCNTNNCGCNTCR